MKSLKAQLMAAIAMTLVAALTIGSSTYAWFTMNSTVTASGMQVRATSGGNVLIAYDADATDESIPSDSSFKTSASANMTESAVLAPASTINLQTWYSATADQVDAKTAKTGTYTKITETTGKKNYNGNFVKQTFYLLAGSDMNVYLSDLTVTVGGEAPTMTGNEIWHALRVGVLSYDGESGAAGSYHIYALSPKYADGSATGLGTDATAVGAKESGDTAIPQVINTDGSTIFTTSTSVKTNYAATLTANEKIKTEIFVWFEGEDGTCYTNNLDIDDVAVSVKFSDSTK